MKMKIFCFTCVSFIYEVIEMKLSFLSTEVLQIRFLKWMQGWYPTSGVTLQRMKKQIYMFPTRQMRCQFFNWRTRQRSLGIN